MHTLDKLCAAVNGTYTITRDTDLPTVRVALALPSGDTMTGNGATTAAAVADLVEKCRKFDVIPAEADL